MSLAVGTPVKIRAFDGVVIDPNVSGLQKIHEALQEGFSLVEDETGIIHIMWTEDFYGDESVVTLVEEFVDGGIYKDSEGGFFSFDANDQGWQTFGSTYLYAYSVPVRPLTRVDE